MHPFCTPALLVLALGTTAAAPVRAVPVDRSDPTVFDDPPEQVEPLEQDRSPRAPRVTDRYAPEQLRRGRAPRAGRGGGPGGTEGAERTAPPRRRAPVRR